MLEKIEDLEIDEDIKKDWFNQPQNGQNAITANFTMGLKKNSVMTRARDNSKLGLNEVDNSPDAIIQECNKYLKLKKIDIDTENAISNTVLIDMMKSAFGLHMT